MDVGKRGGGRQPPIRFKNGGMGLKNKGLKNRPKSKTIKSRKNNASFQFHSGKDLLGQDKVSL